MMTEEKNEITWIKWDKLSILACPYLRYLRVFNLLKTTGKIYERNGVWVAKEEYPCDTICNHSSCQERGISITERLETVVILKSKKVFNNGREKRREREKN